MAPSKIAAQAAGLGVGYLPRPAERAQAAGRLVIRQTEPPRHSASARLVRRPSRAGVTVVCRAAARPRWRHCSPRRTDERRFAPAVTNAGTGSAAPLADEIEPAQRQADDDHQPRLRYKVG